MLNSGVTRMLIKYLSVSVYFILSLILTVISAFGFSFLIVPHHPVDPYQLMEEATNVGDRITSDWWDEVYIPEKHHERFAVLAEKRGNVFKMLFVMLLPIVFCGCWLIFIRRRQLGCDSISVQHST